MASSLKGAAKEQAFLESKLMCAHNPLTARASSCTTARAGSECAAAYFPRWAWPSILHALAWLPFATTILALEYGGLGALRRYR